MIWLTLLVLLLGVTFIVLGSRERNANARAIGIVMTVVGFGALLVLGDLQAPDVERPRRLEDQEGWTTSRMRSSNIVVSCREAVQRQLVSPTTASWVRTPDPFWNGLMSRWQHQVHVDSQNVFGAMIRTTWSCIVAEGGQATATLN